MKLLPSKKLTQMGSKFYPQLLNAHHIQDPIWFPRQCLSRTNISRRRLCPSKLIFNQIWLPSLIIKNILPLKLPKIQKYKTFKKLWKQCRMDKESKILTLSWWTLVISLIRGSLYLWALTSKACCLLMRRILSSIWSSWTRILTHISSTC